MMMLYNNNNNSITTNNKDEGDNNCSCSEEFLASASLGPCDVICGRGRGAFHNRGNRRFRDLIGENIHAYNNNSSRHRRGQLITRLAYKLLHEKGARFYRISSKKEGQKRQLIELPEKQVRQKIGRALCDMAAYKENQQQKLQKSMTTGKVVGWATPRRLRPRTSIESADKRPEEKIENDTTDTVIAADIFGGRQFYPIDVAQIGRAHV